MSQLYICPLITSSVNKYYVPNTRKESQVKMIPKPMKKNDAENYRPVSPINCIAKISETAVKNVVLTHCEYNVVFGEKQSASEGTAAQVITCSNLLITL